MINHSLKPGSLPAKNFATSVSITRLGGSIWMRSMTVVSGKFPSSNTGPSARLSGVSVSSSSSSWYPPSYVRRSSVRFVICWQH